MNPTTQTSDGLSSIQTQPAGAQAAGLTPENPLANLTSNPGMMPAEQALELFMQDPVGFIRRIVGDEAETHLAALKEQAELHGAINAFRKSHPEFQRFESFILQEAATLLQGNDTTGANSWSEILEKAMDNFKQKFTQTLLENQTPGNSVNSPPHVEGAGNRTADEAPATFTREQIAKMSLPDFLKNESAINDALKNNRIH
jgi:hypothetical protein